MKKNLRNILLTIPLWILLTSPVSERTIQKKKELLAKKYDLVIEDIFEKTSKNVYTPDSLVYKKEYIQHPDTTIKKGTGDCDDLVAFADYTFWRNGLPCKVCVGKLDLFYSDKYHSWIEFEKNDSLYIMECTTNEIIAKNDLKSTEYIPIEDEKAYNKFKNAVKDYKKRTGMKFHLKKYKFNQ